MLNVKIINAHTEGKKYCTSGVRSSLAKKVTGDFDAIVFNAISCVASYRPASAVIERDDQLQLSKNLPDSFI